MFESLGWCLDCRDVSNAQLLSVIFVCIEDRMQVLHQRTGCLLWEPAALLFIWQAPTQAVLEK